jgi:hypothetical protein
MWRTITLCSFFGREMNTGGSGVWWMISLASVDYGGSGVGQHLLRPHSVFQPIRGWSDFGFLQLLLTHSLPEGALNLGGSI